MFTKLTNLLLAGLLVFSAAAYAQQKTVTGTVSDNTNQPLPGVNVIVKGTPTGTQTDFDGNFSINVSQGQTLVFSYLGFQTLEVAIGTSNTLRVALTEDTQALDEVVVTALGIERSSRSIGYAVSTVTADELNVVRETNAINALQGKTSGVQITNQSGNLGGSTKILIRGAASLGGNNQPLWVIDGVPVSDANIASGSRITGGFDFGNRAQDINPDDIASVTVLKGASAAALYGSRAANGVILVTTKKGKTGSKVSFSASSDFRWDEPLKLPNFQEQYAAGDDGAFDFNLPIGQQGTVGWGPALSTLTGQTFINEAGQEVPFRLFKNRVRDFYDTGVLRINSFSASGSSEPGDDYRLSMSYTEQEGLVPNSELNRLNLSLNAGKNLSKWLKSRVNVNYVRTNTQGTAAGGANDPNVLTNIVNGLPITSDINLFRDFKDDSGNQINPVGLQTNNPFWIAFQNAPDTEVERFFGSASLEFLPLEGLSILTRAGYDTFTDQRLLKNEIGTLGRADGSFTDDFIKNREFTFDLITTYEKELSSSFNLIARGGLQWNQRVLDRIGNSAQSLTVPGLFDPGNAEANAPFKAFSERRILGVYGDLTLDYKNWLILNVTGRNDWSSTLPDGNNSFFYPSVNLSWIFTDALGIKNDILSYGKLRGSWANVGNDTGAFLLDFTFNPDTGFFGQFGTGGTFPFDGQLAFNSDGFITDPNLDPENQENYEIGLEFGLFKNRVNVDFTYFENYTEDQIIFLPTPQSSGFGSLLTNIGEISNKGIEIEVNARVLKLGDFSWDLDWNFTTVDFTVEDLGSIGDNGGRFVLPDTEFNGLQIVAEEGGSLELFGPRFLRRTDPDTGEILEDQIVVNEDGVRQVGPAGKLGEVFPDFNMGLTTTFSYKGFTVSSTFDWREGGKMFSNTVGQLRRSGLAAETAANGRANLIDTGAVLADGSPNNIEVTPQLFWTNFANASIIEGNIFDATFIKWRELSVSYTFPSSVLEKTFIKGAKIGFQARNLAIFNTNVPHVDPEAGLFGAASNTTNIERGGVPSARSLGLNLQLNF